MGEVVKIRVVPNAPKTAAALLPEFDWDKVSCEDIRIPEGLFC